MGAAARRADHPQGRARHRRDAFHRDAFIVAWERFFDRWDVLLLPAGPTTAERLSDQIKTADGVVIPDDQLIWGYLMWGLHGLAAVPGCPAVALPLALDRAGLPIGVQVMGRRWDDERLLAIAELLEEVTGGGQRSPGH
jgi:amidase